MESDRRPEKVLELSWNCETDMFHFNFAGFVKRAEELTVTKRDALSLLAGLYDLLGVISPVTVSMKILFQQLCVHKLDWDEELTDAKKG